MAVFLNTRGRSRLAIALCARCSKKFPWSELSPDPNYPALMVCRDDKDQFDPWRLPPRATEQISLPWARPDTPVQPGAWSVPVLPIQVGISVGPDELLSTEDYEAIAADVAGSTLQQSTAWTPGTAYGVGAIVTPGNPVGSAAVGQTIYQFQCVLGGQSGATAPAWTDNMGAIVRDGNVLWMNQGLYLP